MSGSEGELLKRDVRFFLFFFYLIYLIESLPIFQQLLQNCHPYLLLVRPS